MQQNFRLAPWKKILVFGDSGQLATAFKEVLPVEKSLFKGRAQTDLSDTASVLKMLDSTRPDLIINTAAYTQVDQAEKDVAACTQLNATAVGEIARWCSANNCFLVHFSTDYVFDGAGDQPFQETDATAPLNVYGQTKLEGERLITASGAHHLIFRTSWVFHESGNNFIKLMLRLGQEKTQLQVVDDQISSPTYALDLAITVAGLLDKKSATDLPSGIYHLAGQGYCSRLELTRFLLAEASRQGRDIKVTELVPAKSSQFPTPARRPLNSKLDSSKATRELGATLPQWTESVKTLLGRLPS